MVANSLIIELSILGCGVQLLGNWCPTHCSGLIVNVFLHISTLNLIPLCWLELLDTYHPVTWQHPLASGLGGEENWCLVVICFDET